MTLTGLLQRDWSMNGFHTQVWLLLDCSCPGGGVDSYKVLPFSYDNVAGTFQQNRGLEYETYTGGVRLSCSFSIRSGIK